jgi:hypothetical protein
MFLYRLGLITIGALEVIRSVLPSGWERTTAAVPILPPPPARLSMTKDLAQGLGQCLAHGRAAMSDGPPGGHGTTTVTVLSGQAWARALSETTEAAKAKASDLESSFISGILWLIVHLTTKILHEWRKSEIRVRRSVYEGYAEIPVG